MSKPLRVLRPARRAVARIPRHPQRRYWLPGGISAASIDEDVIFSITMSLTATYPDTDPTATFAILMTLAGDIGITQAVGALLEGRAPYNPASLESRT